MPPPTTPSRDVVRAEEARGSGRGATRSVAREGPSKARFRRAKRCMRLGGSLFFDPRPVVRQPSGDRLGIALARNPLGPLRRVALSTQPGAEVSSIERDAPFLANEDSQASGGPQFGREAMLGRTVAQPTKDDLGLGRRQLAGTTTDALCRQAG